MPDYIKESINEAKTVIFKFKFSGELEGGYYRIPLWLTDFDKMETLSLENAELESLDIIKTLSIKQFIFNNVKLENEENVISILKQFNELQQIDCEEPLYLRFKKAFIGKELKINLI